MLTYFHKNGNCIYRDRLGITICETKRRKLQLFYNRVNKNTPNYIIIGII
jgi:hypothetical protein